MQMALSSLTTLNLKIVLTDNQNKKGDGWEGCYEKSNVLSGLSFAFMIFGVIKLE